MTTPPPDGSRDLRIEDPSNRWLIHPAARALLPAALRARVPADAVSVAGLLLGLGAATAFGHWRSPVAVAGALLLMLAWLVMDGLDGKIARATGKSSAWGRALDGMCDHLVFIAAYVAVAGSIGTASGWTLAVVAGAGHAVQSALYEGERYRFHRRLKGESLTPAGPRPLNPLVWIYDAVAGGLDRLTRPFERALAAAPDPLAAGRRYGDAAVPPMRLMALLTANTRVFLLASACFAGAPTLFWWAEIGPLTLILLIGLAWHRRVETQCLLAHPGPAGDRPHLCA